MKTTVVIPALNEAASIGLVVEAIPREGVSEIIVVDNGSTDETARVAEAAGATVLYEARRGYGWACLRGIAHARRSNPEVLVFLDGDFSDFPEELGTVLEPIAQNRADLVIGSRTLGSREPGALLPQARFGNWIACGLMRLFWGVRFTDLGPFRAIRYPDLVRLDMHDKTYGWTIEMQIKAAQWGLRCTEVPVSYRKRIGVSKVTGTIAGTVKASVKILWMILRYALRPARRSRRREG